MYSCANSEDKSTNNKKITSTAKKASTEKNKTQKKPRDLSARNIFNLYKNNCVVCHGMDGSLGLGGAGNLTLSKLPKKNVVEIITNGKGKMTPYKDLLSENEIDMIADFVMALRDNTGQEDVDPHIHGHGPDGH